MKKTIALFLLAGLMACSSKQKKVEEVDTKLTDEQTAGVNASVGTNKDGDVVYQRKVDLVNQLVNLQDEVNNLQDKVYGNPDYDSKGIYGKALQCRKKKSQKTGELSFVPDKTPVVEEDQVKVSRDARTKKLIGLDEENLAQRLDRFKNYKKVLYDRQDQLEAYIDKCELDLAK